MILHAAIRRVSKILRATSLLALVATLHAPRAGADEVDVPDMLFRYTKASAVAVSQAPEERIDPFSGNLRIVHQDLSLPQKGGLGLVIQRVYSSKIWGRVDAAMVPVEAAKANFIGRSENSPLGPGWTMTLGLLRNPSGRGGTDTRCNLDLPIFQDASGKSDTFYCSDGTGVGWYEHDTTLPDGTLIHGHSCTLAEKRSIGGARLVPGNWSTPAAHLYTEDGLTYDFDRANSYCRGDDPCHEWEWTTSANVVIPVSRISDSHGNVIEITYYSGSKGAMKRITDSYGRQIDFEYDAAKGEYVAMTANGARTEYAFSPVWVAGFGTAGPFDLGPVRMLSAVKLPGDGDPTWHYDYLAHSISMPSLRRNVGALKTITYPAGGTITYEYGNTTDGVDFVTGNHYDWPCILRYTHSRFAPVTKRTQGGRDVLPADTTYAYTYDLGEMATGSVCVAVREGTQITTVTRPDGKHDVYTFEGWGARYSGQVWKVGLLKSTSIADGARVTETTWQSAIRFPGIYNIGPDWREGGGLCTGVRPFDGSIMSAQPTRERITQDGVSYVTDYTAYDGYDQPHSIKEYVDAAGAPQRTTTRTFFVKDDAPPLFIRGRVQSETRCIASDCVTDSSGYDPLLGDLLWTDKADPAVRTTYTYQPDGDVHSVTDPEGSVVTLAGYDHGLPTTVDMAGLLTMTRTVSWEGRELTRTIGVDTTLFEYDAGGRLRKRTPDVGAREIYLLSDPTRVRLTKEGTSFFHETRVDGFGRTIATEDSEGNLTQTIYDALGRLAFQSYPYQGTPKGETSERDGLGRVTKTTHPDSTFTTVAYAGLEVDSTNELSRTWRVTSEAFGRPEDSRIVSVIDPLNAETTYEYDVANDLLRVDEQGLSSDRTYIYDTRRLKVGEVNPESGLISYVVDDVGNPLSRTDALRTVTFSYDLLHRPTGIDYPGVMNDATFGYDPANGWRSSASSPAGGTFFYGHDDTGRLTSQIWSKGGVNFSTSYVYDAAGCLTSMTYPTGRVVPMTCDTLARPTHVDGFVPVASYHPSGGLKQFTYENGRTTTIGRDDRYRTIDIDAPGIVHMGFGLDAASNVTDILETGPTSGTRSMEYDPLNRLEDAVGPWGAAHYDFDLAGNRLGKSIAGGPSTSYVYDGSTGRLASAVGDEASAYSWDALGNLLIGNGVGYTWNEMGMLQSTTTGDFFQYDAAGRTIMSATPGTGMVLVHYDKDGNKIAETTPNGAPIREYFYLAGRLVAIDGKMAPHGLRACYDFDAETEDWSGYDNDATVNGSVNCMFPGVFGQACHFMGGYVGAPASASLDVGGTPGSSITIEAWIKPAADPSGGGHPIVEYGNASELGTHLWQNLYPQLFGNVVPRDSTFGDKRFAADPTPFVAGTWYHVALVYDGESGVAALYVNGALAAERPAEHYTFKTQQDLLIGKRLYPFDATFMGDIDEVRVWSRPLSPGEILHQATRTTSLCHALRTGGTGDPMLRFVHLDHLGDIVATTTGDTGALLCREGYGPYGETEAKGCEKEAFNGRDYDPSAKIYNYGARFYHPGIGRFVSADSYAGEPANAQTHNRYTYVTNNPFRFTDPTGHMDNGCEERCVESDDGSSFCSLDCGSGGGGDTAPSDDGRSMLDQSIWEFELYKSGVSPTDFGAYPFPGLPDEDDAASHEPPGPISEVTTCVGGTCYTSIGDGAPTKVRPEETDWLDYKWIASLLWRTRAEYGPLWIMGGSGWATYESVKGMPGFRMNLEAAFGMNHGGTQRSLYWGNLRMTVRP